MARIRSVKPELRTSRTVAAWPFEVRYFFVLLWGYLDDKGRGIDVPKAIAGDCFPYDDDISPQVVDNWLELMRTGAYDGKFGPVCRYEVDGQRYIHCVNWSEHQKPNRPTPSRLPACPTHDTLTAPLSDAPSGDSVPGGGEQGSRGAGEGGAGIPPPPRCPQHVDNPNPPACDRCGLFDEVGARERIAELERKAGDQVIVVSGAVSHILDRLYDENSDLLGMLELDRSTCTVRFVPATADEVRAERANWSS